MLGMGGVSLSTAQPGNWISLDADASSLEVQYLVEPDGGDIEIYDGDQMLQHISTAGPTAAGHFDTPVQAGPHHFEVRTTSYAPVRLFGMVTEEAAGVTYESMGLNGAEAGLILHWNEVLQQELMAQRDIALIVLACMMFWQAFRWPAGATVVISGLTVALPVLLPPWPWSTASRTAPSA